MEIEKTADGSYTLFVPELDEHYHSVKGALTESEHIFINMGFKHSQATSPHILEIGFGTGLNAFLTSLEAKNEKRNISLAKSSDCDFESSRLRILRIVVAGMARFTVLSIPVYTRLNGLRCAVSSISTARLYIARRFLM